MLGQRPSEQAMGAMEAMVKARAGADPSPEGEASPQVMEEAVAALAVEEAAAILVIEGGRKPRTRWRDMSRLYSVKEGDTRRERKD